MKNGEVSYWWNSIGLPQPGPALPSSREADVCIIGAGYTGLWTAYYLKKADPSLEIVILEQRFAGYGASGRNGGWLTNEITGGVAQYRRSHGPDAVDRMQKAMNDTVDEVIAVTSAEGIDADIRKGGEYTVSRGVAQHTRLLNTYHAGQARAHTDLELLDAEQASQRIGVAGTTGAIWHPHCARIHPAKLASGLADTVRRLGVTIYENTRVTQIRPHEAVTEHGTVTARHIVRATEGFTANIDGLHRDWLPLNSSMIATDPIPDSVWDEIGWSGGETLGDHAHVYMYAQRTADNRIALGGRGVPYRYGSKIVMDGQNSQRTIDMLRAILDDFFPQIAGIGIAHTWSGVLGVPRDWHATVGLDPQTGLGWAGGFVGTGVTSTNLAGRTLRDLILGEATELTNLPWVGHTVRKWEIEPLRYLGVSSMYAAYRAADASEVRGRTTTSPIAHVADLISGH